MDGWVHPVLKSARWAREKKPSFKETGKQMSERRRDDRDPDG